MKFIKFIKELSAKDLGLVGGKAANLGEMVNAGLPVPNAFVVTVDAYRYFLEKTGIKDKIFEILRRTDINNTSQLQENTKRIRELIEGAEVPEEVMMEIKEAYKTLSKEFGKEEEYVAVRSSATAEDVPGASFAGQQLTLLNVKGVEKVIDAVKKCWASLFTARATFYRATKGFEHEKVLIAIPVQKQLGAMSKEDYLEGKYKAGVGFTIHPATGEKDRIVIEASWGQGESVVSGAVTPDTYIIDKKSGKVVEKHIGKKSEMRYTDLEKGGLVEIEVPKEMQEIECLTENELKQLWELALKLEEHYKFPQDFEWASENGKVFLLQSRPVTVFYEKKIEEIEIKQKPILKGLPASPGVAIGRVKIVFDPEEAAKKIEKGDILVTKMTSPDWVPYMRISAGIITSEGGITCISGNTLLLTNEGFIKAEELYRKVKENRKVKLLSFDTKSNKFKFKTILATGRNRKKLIRVQISNKRKNSEVDVLDISPDHKFITFLNGKLVKIPLDDILEEKMGVLIPEKIEAFQKRELDDKLVYLIGLTISDGYLEITNRRGKLVLSQKLTGKRKMVGERFMKYCNLLVDGDVKVYKKSASPHFIGNRVIRGSSENFNLILHNKWFATKINSFIDNLDRVILTCSENNLQHFLAGVLDGDGSISSDAKRVHIYVDPTKFKTYSSIMLALLKLGIHPQVCLNRKIYNIQLVEKLGELINLTVRFRDVQLKKRTKYKSTRYFLARQILQSLLPKFSYRGRLKVYIEKNLLIGEKEIRKIIKNAEKKGVKLNEIKSILNLPFRQSRIRKIKDLGVDYVYNFEVEGESELDKNFVVFTNTLTPVLVSNSHAAIVSRELSVPCIVGATNALTTLKDGQLITLDARRGLVYEGEVKELLAREKALEVTPEEAAKLKTKTKILMNLGEPEVIERYKDLPFEGIGLMRIEFIIASWVGEHPNYLLEKGEGEKYINKLADGIAIVAKAIYPRFVVVRFSDFKTNEYRELTGGEKYEPKESNPMLGWRGVSRYISKEFEEAFRLECRAIKKVREEMGLDNVWVMLPFVRTTWEVEKCLKIMEEEGLKRGMKNFKVWLMAEVPSIIFLADEFAKLCDGFSIGSNDLTQLVLGIDRDSAILANMGYFDERNEAVKRAIRKLIEDAHKNNVSVSICGQAPSVYSEFTEFLVKCGIDSISVNPDVVSKTRKLVYNVEEKLKTEKEWNMEKKL